jgi:hypothetical protein
MSSIDTPTVNRLAMQGVSLLVWLVTSGKYNFGVISDADATVVLRLARLESRTAPVALFGKSARVLVALMPMSRETHAR